MRASENSYQRRFAELFFRKALPWRRMELSAANPANSKWQSALPVVCPIAWPLGQLVPNQGLAVAQMVPI